MGISIRKSIRGGGFFGECAKFLTGAPLIAVIVFAIYLPSLRGGTLFDDESLIHSKLVKSPGGLFRIWFSTESTDYWPVTNTMFWIEHRLFGNRLAVYRAVNLAVHIADSLLVWLLLRQLSIPGSFLAALLFAVHPVNVGSVAWVSQLKNLLAMLFALLATLWYMRSGAVDAPTERFFSRGAGGWYWLSMASFVAAMLSKGSIAVLPLVLLLVVWWKRGEIRTSDWLRVAPLFSIAIVLTAANLWFRGHGGEVAIRDADALQRILGAAGAVWFYLYKSLVPIKLLFFYPQWDIDPRDAVWWLPLLAAVAATAVLSWKRGTQWGRPLLFAWAFFCVSLLPVMGLVDVGYMQYSPVANHYAHLALIGVVALAGAGWALWNRRQAKVSDTFFTCLVCVLAISTWLQARLYGNPVKLYQASLEGNPDSAVAHNMLGFELDAAGQSEAACSQYEAAAKLNPKDGLAHNNWGLALEKLNRLDEAVAQYEQAAQLRPHDPDPFTNVGNLMVKVGRPQQAVRSLQHAIDLRSDSSKAYSNMGTALAALGRLPDAIKQFEKAVELDRDNAMAHYNWALALASSGQLNNAATQFRQAISAQPDYPEAHNNLGVVLQAEHRLPEAVAEYQTAIQQKSDFIPAHDNLARAYAALGQPDEAIATAERAAKLSRDQGQTAFAEQIEAWLRRYRDEHPPLLIKK